MKIGIFLAYMPGTKLGSEGLGRYIGNLIKGFTDDNNEVCIACPKWLVESLYDLLDDFHVQRESVQILTSHRVPIIWRLYDRIFNHNKEIKIPRKILVYHKLADLLDFTIDKLISISSGILFAGIILLAVLLGILLFPLVLIAILIAILFQPFQKIRGKARGGVKQLLWKLSHIKTAYSQKGESVQQRAFDRLYQVTVQELIRRVNTMEEDVWFVPTLFWPEAAKIKALTVFAAPDMVSVEFPFPFAEWVGGVAATKNCAKTIKDGKYFITYCDFIKKDVLMRQYGKKNDQVISISHINNSSYDHVNILCDYEKYGMTHQEINEKFCRELLSRLPQYSTQEQFLQNYDFREVRYIFYASQQRPHKNILTLIKAYEYLLRTKSVNYKLFMTCDMSASPSILSYVQEHGLEHDVISFTRIPVQLLSALYACAEIVVVPTLYEGGFLTYPLGEGMSVGTPALMSRISQVTDMIPSVYPLEEIVFDPLNYLDMAEKIDASVHNAKNLYEAELPMYRDVEARTAPIVARDYVQAFQHFAKVNEEEKKNEKTGVKRIPY